MMIQSGKRKLSFFERAIRKWLEKRGFEDESIRETILCKWGYFAQLTLWIMYIIVSAIFIIRDKVAFPALLMNSIGFVLCIVCHVTSYYEIKRQLEAPLVDVPFDVTEKNGEFHRGSAIKKLRAVLTILFYAVFASLVWLPPGVSLVTSNVMKSISIVCLVLYCKANIENVFENMFLVNVKEVERKDD